MENAPEKIDLYKEHKEEYRAGKKPEVIDVGPARYLMIEGKGEPGGEAFEEAIGALYGAAYTIKMTRKFAGRGNYKVCNLEAQWWVCDPENKERQLPQSEWRWNLMIRVPEFIAGEDLRAAQDSLVKKGKGEITRRVKLEDLREGTCVQAMHVGPYDRVCETIGQIDALMKEKGLELSGAYHEIYLNDPRRCQPEKLKTIVRMPTKGINLSKSNSVWWAQAHPTLSRKQP